MASDKILDKLYAQIQKNEEEMIQDLQALVMKEDRNGNQ